MSSTIVLIICIIFCIFIYRIDAKRNADVSWTFWIPTLWFMRSASRGLSYWLGNTNAIDATEGSLPDQIFFSVLMVMAFIVLYRRKINWPVILSGNVWIVLFFIYMLVSVLWSDITSISLKRWIRTSGDLMMVLVILTDVNPLKGIAIVFRRCFVFLIPISIVLSKYFPDIGRMTSKHWAPDMWIGVATHKNTLGQLALLSGIYFVWDLTENQDKRIRLLNLLYLLMTLYLLAGHNGSKSSATSIVLLIIGTVIYALIRRYKQRLHYLRVAVIGSIMVILSLIFIDKVLFDSSLINFVIEFQGRDPTFTGRTELWTDVIALGMQRPILGTGFSGFWSPERVDYLKEIHTWGPLQSHNGYIEIFINLGLVGLILFFIAIIAAINGALRQCYLYFEYGVFRLIFLIVAIIHNYSEAGFTRPTHLMWFLFLLMAVNVWYVYPQKQELQGASA